MSGVPGSKGAAGSDVECEEGAPAGNSRGNDDDNDMQGKPAKYLYEVQDNDVERVALHEEIGVAPLMRPYRDGFLGNFGKHMNPKWRPDVQRNPVKDYAQG